MSSTTYPASEIETAIRRVLHVFRAAKDPLHEKMEPSSAAFDMMERLHQSHSQIGSIRAVILVVGLAKRFAEFEPAEDLPDTQIDIWDLERLYRADTSGLTYESFDIDLAQHLGEPLRCLAAATDEPDHKCFFTVFPGELLHDLYHKYGARLLELNVRSFLQARGKVNRGLRDTLLKEPEHFLAFNNGISVTVEDLTLDVDGNGGLSIRSIRGLQIVNGGQTIASIHRAKTPGTRPIFRGSSCRRRLLRLPRNSSIRSFRSSVATRTHRTRSTRPTFLPIIHSMFEFRNFRSRSGLLVRVPVGSTKGRGGNGRWHGHAKARHPPGHEHSTSERLGHRK